MKLSSTPLNVLLEAFRSSAPTPGGGSAAALAGAVGASLLAMVARLPKPRASGEPDLNKLADAGRRAEELARGLEGLVDQDAEAYDMVVAAYRLPKASDEEKAARSTCIQEALRAAIDTPLEVMRRCAAGITEGPVLLALGNPNASSDVKVGLELLRAGLRGAKLNVEINLDSIKDNGYAAAVRAEMEALGRRVSESGGAAAPSEPS
jgi:formiminotetrahydrofolate cyclodeaminase